MQIWRHLSKNTFNVFASGSVSMLWGLFICISSNEQLLDSAFVVKTHSHEIIDGFTILPFQISNQFTFNVLDRLQIKEQKVSTKHQLLSFSNQIQKSYPLNHSKDDVLWSHVQDRSVYDLHVRHHHLMQLVSVLLDVWVSLDILENWIKKGIVNNSYTIQKVENINTSSYKELFLKQGALDRPALSKSRSRMIPKLSNALIHELANSSAILSERVETSFWNSFPSLLLILKRTISKFWIISTSHVVRSTLGKWDFWEKW